MSILNMQATHQAIETSVPFHISDPLRYVHADDTLRALVDALYESEDLLRCGEVEDGFRHAFWAPFLLAVSIGYDAYIVHSLGETAAEFISQPGCLRSVSELIALGKSLGIHRPEQYFIAGRSREEISLDLRRSAIEQVKFHTRPYGLKMLFWAVCVRASDFDLSATSIPGAVGKTASIYRTFGAGK